MKKKPANPADIGLAVHGLTVRDARKQTVVDHISFEVRAGEILGIAGVQGNGQTELTEALLGLKAEVSGDIVLNGRNLAGCSTREVLTAGVGYVPEDRQQDGLVASFSIAENLMLDRFDGEPFVHRGGLRPGLLRQFAEDKIREFDVRAQSSGTPVGQLSGGNQQKVVLARELSRDLTLFVASQPTRGVDVGSIEFIHQQIVATRDAGIPVIVISTELDEVIALSDRIAVMYRGHIVGIVPATTSRDVLGLMMAGDTAAGLEHAG
ncbi:ATP-binding cassette domain-containing protein [Streptomyces acidicola]|uniref:ATP-binding cassette domain-containing protein n=1 Tax=Streptomyces acidicola TaxID=2596892 RepID=UPI0034230C22